MLVFFEPFNICTFRWLQAGSDVRRSPATRLSVLHPRLRHLSNQSQRRSRRRCRTGDVLQKYVRTIYISLSLPSNRQHLSCDDCVDDKEWRLSELFCVVSCTAVVHRHKHTHMNSSHKWTTACWFRLGWGLLVFFCLLFRYQQQFSRFLDKTCVFNDVLFVKWT